ncbi:class I SAM-dependent methyltransferase [Streptacidiphilus fuscans]|uniref:Methyltransferase domain-containing protein n=1 Tax=Streptacidiphilus fuscans TaxID=2789292 RepID=A0A931B1J3_9ACTN|nr:methyltransferase domain-containing protein [Streptacidiphilus fuscans]MBF9068591.1 methyltransferase domain-containing protein [Streptacidiphilus fuscans]
MLGWHQYLTTGQEAELERIRLESTVWEPAGRRLLELIGDGRGRRALDVGCGSLGWLRLLSDWTGESGAVLGADADRRRLEHAAGLVEEESLVNVRLIVDDPFASELEPRGFDLVHARLALASLGRAEEQLAGLLGLVAPGGVLVLEEPDTCSWRFNAPTPAPAAERLIGLVREAAAATGGDLDAGRQLPALFRRLGLTPHLRTEVLALEPGHPYLRSPLQLAETLRPRLLASVDEEALDALIAAATGELADPERWGTSFTMVQCWARVCR